MKIILRDEREGALKLSIDNLDDLWHLSRLIMPGDEVFGVTFRAAEKPSDMTRSKKTEKKRVYLGIEVEKTEFQQFSDRLRVHGTVTHGEEALNSYHTLNFQVGDTIKAIKKIWSRSVLERIEHAVTESKKPLLLIVAIDDETADIAMLRSYGVQELALIRSGKTGKMYKEAGKDGTADFFGQIMAAVQHNWTEGVPVVIVGPGFTASDLKDKIRSGQLPFSKMTICEATAHAGHVGIYEAIKRGIVKRVDAENRLAAEIEAVERFMEMLAKNEPVAYGTVEISKALGLGAVDMLLVLDSVMWNEAIQRLMKTADTIGASIMVISSLHDSGKRLEHLGGVGATLRYSIH